MANLTGISTFKAFLRKLETTDPKHPDTWNPNYQALINNDVFLKEFANEVQTARGGKTALAQRLQEIEQTQASLTPEFLNDVVAAVKFAIDQAALANYGVKALRQQAQQEGIVTIANRGIVTGCVVTKSTTAARNLSIAAGVCFANGRQYSVAPSVNAASVPSNTGSGSVTVYAYLFLDTNKLMRLAVTPIGTSVPDGAIVVYSLTVPPSSTDATDPNLTNVTLTDRRRIETLFPAAFDSPATTSVALQTLAGNDYVLAFDVLDAIGAPCNRDAIHVSSRATNGFTLLLASAADSVTLRWKASRLHN